MRRTLMIAAVATATLGIGAAQASAPGEWAALDRRVTTACIAMSGLTRPQVLAKKMSFSDDIGVEVRMVRGTDKRGKYHRMLCAYNRKTGRTEVQDAASWLGATTKP